MITRTGEFKKKQVLSKKMEKKLNGKLAYHILKYCPGSAPYMATARREIYSTSYHIGPPLFFITISAHPRKWNNLFAYLKEINKFRAFPPPENQAFQDYEVNFTIQYIHQVFQAILAILKSEKPNFFKDGQFDR